MFATFAATSFILGGIFASMGRTCTRDFAAEIDVCEPYRLDFGLWPLFSGSLLVLQLAIFAIGLALFAGMRRLRNQTARTAHRDVEVADLD